MHVFTSRASLPVLFVSLVALGAGLLMGSAGMSRAVMDSESVDITQPPREEPAGRQIAVSNDGKTIAYFWLFSNGSNIIARTRYSTDGGRKWTNKNLSNSNKQASQPVVAVSDDGKTIAYAWVSSTDPKVDFAAKAAYTTNSGKTWTTRDLSSDSEGGLNPDIALTEDGQNMYFMYDAGSGIEEVGDQYRFFTTSSVRLWSTSDGGDSWRESEVSPAQNTRRGSVTVSGNNQTIVYTWYARDIGLRMRYSTDFGVNWSTVDFFFYENEESTKRPDPDEANDIVGIDGGITEFNVAVSENGQTISTLYSEAARSTGLFNIYTYYTTDGGNQWTKEFFSGGFNGADSPRVAVSDDGQTLLYAWQEEKTIASSYSSDGGVNWTPYNPAGGDKAKSPEITMSGDGKTWWYAWEKPGNKAKYFSRNTKNGGSSWSKSKKISQPTKSVGRLDVQVSNNARYIGYAWVWGLDTRNRALQTYYSTKGGGSWKTVNLSGSSAVKKLKIRKASGVKTQVQWKKPEQVDSSGVKKYEVRHKAASADSWKKWKSAKPKKLKIGDQKYAKSVGKLKVGKKYEVQVRTKNSVSPGQIAVLKFKAKK